MFRKKRNQYKFTDRIHPKGGIASVLLAILMYIVVIILCIESSNKGGDGPLYYGVVGILCLIVSLLCFWLGVNDIRKESIYRLFPILGMLLNGVLFIGLFSLYFIGMSI